MKRMPMRYFFFLILLLPLNTIGQELSDQSTISIITCSPGNMLYSQFGHSAIRVKDDSQNLDIVFNYGTFDFDTPYFYLKFTRGKLNYKLSVNYFKDFKASYINENRSIYEQKLNISLEEKQKLFKALLVNYQPENRYYKYNFLFDNCTTRVRDLIENNLEKTIEYLPPKRAKWKFFMGMLKEYLTHSPWIRLSFDIILGQKIYDHVTHHQEMFLPDYLMLYYEHTFYDNADLLFQPVNTIFEANRSNQSVSFVTSPIFIFSILLLFFILLGLLNVYPVFIDYSLLFLSGLIGMLLVFLWFFTDHETTKWNIHVLWAFPFNFFVTFFLFRKRKPLWTKRYFVFSGLLIVLAAIYYIITFGKYEWSFYLLFLLFAQSILRLMLRINDYKILKGKFIRRKSQSTN